MVKITDILKLRILIAFWRTGYGGVTVTGLAKTLGEEKYSISRAVASLSADGLIDKSNPRSPLLTDEGKYTARYYNTRINTILNGLRHKGVGIENAENDAFYLAMYCSDQTFEAVKALEQRSSFKSEIGSMVSFSGELLDKKLKDGTYRFPYIIYRESIVNGTNISPFNSAFEHPCLLEINNGVGTVRFWYKSNYQGKRIKSFEYFLNGKYYSTEMVGDILHFPIEAVVFENLGQGVGQILHGSACVRIKVMNEHNRLEERCAIFTILI